MEQDTANKALITGIFAKWEDLKAKRMPFEADWDLITMFCAPRTIGAKFQIQQSLLTQYLTDTTAVDAGERFPAMLYGYLIGSSNAFAIPEVRGRDKVSHEEQQWLDFARDKTHKFFKHGDVTFKKALYQQLYQHANYGTGMGWSGGPYGGLPRFRAVSCFDSWYDRDADGKIFIFYRRIHMSAHAAVIEYPDSEEMKELAKESAARELEFLVAVEMRENGRKGGAVDRKPFASHTINVDKKVLMKIEGYDSMPFDAGLFQDGPGGNYGRGCGHKAVPIAIRLNRLHSATVDGAEHAVRPTLFDFTNGALKKFDRRAAAVNMASFSALGFKNINEALQAMGPTGDLRPGIEMINKAETQIEKAYYIDWMNNSSGPAKTAYEVSDQRDLRFKALSPMITSLETDVLGVKMDRAFEMLLRYGAFPSMPDSLRGETIDFSFRSALAAAMDDGEIEAIMKSVGLVKEIAEVDPDVVDNIDGDKLFRQGVSDFGLPAGLLPSPDDVTAKREARAEAAQQAQELEQAQQVGAALRDGAQGLATLENAGNGGAQ